MFLSASLILEFKDAVQMLRDNGIEMGDEDDLRFVYQVIWPIT